ncbi:hypothetical protein C6Z68_003678 [Salmonella enterica subsp. enterica serovar 4,[5],12:i:-]|uniref:Uncharacterized protein n=1 Tax=Enterobacter hormaechei TaxID=158836 RepID=A0A3S7QH83_9ENTR|nr:MULTISPECIES: hypothetical protein [Gammaproteobacteria]AZT48739.1 hypothetical protein ELZ82_23330 [Salmonella enterica subsp. enterica serovar Mikawasima]ECB8932543.1 hypothetical protein [Salmonella enterica subsp. enterica serovar 4,[5],12:i:-]ECJ3831192.1 hypothetical protein [Salmonella enterica subsp. enterica serovar 4,12:r:-]EDF9470532.1 hypothetical protein [Salmonella enterica subsp. enterica]EKT8282331.1 hypothetical protein [Klebsiella pneumoniae]EKV8809949.1 hypothetical prot
MALSKKRRAARVFMLRHAAGWLMDLESTDLCNDANGEYDDAKVAESKLVAKRLEAMADRLESKR